MKDLFEHRETLPQAVLDLIDTYVGDFNYEDCANEKDKLEKLGYTFDYGLDAEPHSLRKVTIAKTCKKE